MIRHRLLLLSFLLIPIWLMGCAHRLSGPLHRADGPPWIADGVVSEVGEIEIRHRVILIGDTGYYL